MATVGVEVAVTMMLMLTLGGAASKQGRGWGAFSSRTGLENLRIAYTTAMYSLLLLLCGGFKHAHTRIND